jgi:hypothetical protein
VALYHSTPSSFTTPTAGTQSVSFALPSAPTGGFTSGTITRVYQDNNVNWSEGFSTASGTDAYNASSAHQCPFPANAGDGTTKTQTVSLTTQQLADLTAGASTTFACTVNHSTRLVPANVYSDLYLTLTPGSGGTTTVSGTAAMVGEAALSAAGTVSPVVTGTAAMVGEAALTPSGTVIVPATAQETGVGSLGAVGLVVVPGTFWGTGYQSIPTAPANDLTDPSGADRYVSSGSGSAACTTLVDFGAAVTLSTLNWQDGTASTYTALWEHSTDLVSWTGVTMPAPPVPSGSFAWGSRTLMLGAPVSARYWRLSVKDTPGGAAIGQAGIRQLTLVDNTGATTHPSGSFASAEGSFTISGVYQRIGNGTELRRKAWVTLFIKTARGPRKLANAHGQPGTYCSDGDISFVQTQTDCNGAYSFTLRGCIIMAAMAIGKYILNPVWDPDCSFDDVDQRLKSKQFIPDPATEPAYRCCTPGPTHWIYPPHYKDATGGAGGIGAPGYYAQDLFFQQLDTTDATALISYSGGTTPCGEIDFSQNGIIARQNIPYCFQYWKAPGWGMYSNFPAATPLSGTFGFDFHDGPDSHSLAMTTWITKNGKYYRVLNAVYSVVDNCGNTESTQLDAQGLYAHTSVIDWPTVTSITLTSALPDCSFTDGYPGSNPNVYGPYDAGSWGPVPTWIYGSDLAPLLSGCVCSILTPAVFIEDCSSTSTPLRADVFPVTRTLGVAWVNAAGMLLTAVHRGPLAYAANSAQGWEATQILEGANASAPGYQFLRNGRAYVDYQLSTVGKYRTNDRQGAGPASAWSATTRQFNSGAAAAGRSPFEDFRFVLSTGGSPTWQLLTSRDNRGDSWLGGGNASAGADGTCCGGAWVGTGYGLLYNTAGSVYYRFNPKPTDWSGVTDISVGSTLTAVGLQRAASGTLVGLLYDPVSQRCRACRSRARGAAGSWELLPFTPTIPKLSTPPALVTLDSALLAVWQTGDQPQFAISYDEGMSWI